jgi:hypothetical protein
MSAWIYPGHRRVRHLPRRHPGREPHRQHSKSLRRPQGKMGACRSWCGVGEADCRFEPGIIVALRTTVGKVLRLPPLPPSPQAFVGTRFQDSAKSAKRGAKPSARTTCSTYMCWNLRQHHAALTAKLLLPLRRGIVPRFALWPPCRHFHPHAVAPEPHSHERRS